MGKATEFIGGCIKKDVIRQFIRYLLVGGLASAADVSLFYIFTGIFGANHILSNTVSFTIGLLINYFLSREWVFGHSGHRVGRDFLIFSVIGVIGLCLSNLILYILLDCRILFLLLGFAGKNIVLFAAKLAAVLTVLFWNFSARKKFVFRSA